MDPQEQTIGDQKFLALFEKALNAIVIADDSGLYVDANPAACQLFGLPREQLIGKRIMEFARPELDFENVWQSFRRKESERGRFTLVRPDGTVRETEYEAVANFFPGYHLSIMRDVTERLWAERERQAALDQLRERVKEARLLQQVALLFNRSTFSTDRLLQALVQLIPPAWHYPKLTGAAITFGGVTYHTPGFQRNRWRQQAPFTTEDGDQGLLEVVLLEPPLANQEPFLVEEQRTLNTLAEMLKGELEQRASEERYSFLLQTMSQGVIFVDGQGLILAANPAAEQILGVSEEVMRGKTVDDSIWRVLDEQGTPSPDEASAVHRALESDEGVKGRIIAVFNPAAEEYRWLRVDVVPRYKADDSEPYLVYALFEDITEWKKNQERLRFQAQLLDSVQEIVVATDLEMNIVYWGQGAQTVYGYTAEEVLGRHYLEVVRPLVLETTETLAQVQEAEIWQGDGQHRRRDGTAFWVTGTVSPVKDEQGRKLGYVGIGRDVTEERIMQEYAQQQQRLASVGQLAAGIAHDFNNIMSAIVLYAQILQQTLTPTPKEAKALNVIHQQAYHATTLIGQILDFSRHGGLERGPLPVLPFIKELMKLWERTLPENIKLKLAYSDEEYLIKADPTRLQQALMNLAINARDAMPEGGRLTVALSSLTLSPDQRPPLPDMAPGRWLRLRLTDTGLGVAGDALPFVFDPFFTTKDPGKGTGLGLAQVYGTVLQHEGHITVSSQPGAGTRFTIYLPQLEDVPLPGPMHDRQDKLRASREACILVVEDDEMVRGALVDTLEAVGYQVLEAADGVEALAALNNEAEQVDLVLTDMVMPELGGIIFLRHLLEHYPEIRVLVISGYPLQGDSQELLDHDQIDWLQKPFSMEKLLEKVTEQWGRQ